MQTITVPGVGMDKAPIVSKGEYLGNNVLYNSSGAAHAMSYEYPPILLLPMNII